MYAELMGQPDVEEVTGAVATSLILLRPPDGELWVLVDAMCYHDDDGAARNCYMQFSDGTAYFNFVALSALAHSTNKWLRTETSNQQKIVLSYSHYFRWKVDSIAAGKKGYIKAMVYKFKGLPADVGA